MKDSVDLMGRHCKWKAIEKRKPRSENIHESFRVGSSVVPQSNDRVDSGDLF